MGARTSNFDFLKERWPTLARNGRLAERYLYSDTNSALFKMRLFSEELIDLLFVALKLDTVVGGTQIEKIKMLNQSNKVQPAVIDLLHIVRKIGNKAAHENYGDLKDAAECMKSIFKLSCWFYVKVTGDRTALPEFKWPEKPSKKEKAPVIDIEEYRKEIDELKKKHLEEIEELKKQLQTAAPNPEKVEREIEIVTNDLGLTEAETRKKLIDILLRDAGWNIDDSEQVKLEYEVSYFPNKNGKGYADYVLWDKKGKPIAVIEAKKTSRDAEVGKHQAKLYADSLEKMYGVRPVIYYTNGHEIYMWDDNYSEPRQVWGFYTLDDLEYLMFQHKSRKTLSNVEIDNSIVERAYQIEGIKRVFEKFENGRRRALMVMATGTGKTRTVIALTRAMMQANWVKRVLFLADRDELVKQAKEQKNSYKVFMPEVPSTRITSANAEVREVNLYFATYQTMINHYDRFSIGFFDLIICDESHRSIYNTYRDILEYFDAYFIGLTATPVNFINRNTFNLFSCDDGDPTFYYSFDDACDHKPPYLLRPKKIDATTDFLRRGIKWSNLTEEQRRQLEEEGYDENQIEFDKKELEEFVTNEDTNRFILENLMNNGIKVGDSIGKTIIFAKNIRHAKLLIELFDEMYPQYNGSLAAVIHSQIEKKEDLLNNFKEAERPRIAISVDMLDTGVDVPEVVNLVFAKPIYSKVKFLQMIGRGTRLCPDLFGKGKDKECFMIFDHWKNFEFFDEKPDGIIPAVTKTSIQIRFERRIELLKIFSQKKDKSKQDEMIRLIRQDIANLPEKSVAVRKQWKTIEWLKLDQTWVVVNQSLIDRLLKEVAPLMQWIDSEDDKTAIWFDNQMYKMQIYKINGDTRLPNHVNSVIYDLAMLRLNLNHFDGIRDYVKSLINETVWYKASYEDVENTRLTLRNLMKYRTANEPGAFVRLDLKDGGRIIREINETYSTTSSDMEPYEERVRTVLEKELNMQLVIRKIRRGESLTKQDIDTVYEIFNSGKVGFTLDELSKNAHVKKKDLVGLLRKFVGVDEKELNVRFGEFVRIHNKQLSATQMKIIEMIKNDIIRNRGISFASLYEPPYTNINHDGFDGIFKGKISEEVIELIKPYKVELEERHA
ncbi:DEAD/DEAH box helicase family protein [Lutispora sp.]|uniref:DEAD/DEAH box helicase family protein n=1 Tax=Lutispora sp. TaxID=2828727 RepID=UPI00356A4CF3